MRPSYEQLVERIQQLEALNTENEFTAAGHISAAFKQIGIPLEIISNLAFLLEREHLSEAGQTYIHLLEEQLNLLVATYNRFCAADRKQDVSQSSSE